MEVLGTTIGEKTASMTYTPEFLGKGKRKSGGKGGKYRRLDVLHKVRGLFGLTSGEKNLYAMFRDHWDDDGLQRRGPDWPEVFLK